VSTKSTIRLAAILGICFGVGLRVCDAEAGSKIAGQKLSQASGNQKKDYPVQPVPFTDVQITDEFWSRRLETNRKVSIPFAFRQCEHTGRIDNFAIAGGLMEGEHRGDYPFDDTDPYKVLEGASYSLSVHADPKLEKYLDDLIVKIAAAQERDGYLYTCRTNNSGKLINWFGRERWSRLNRSHELYNMGRYSGRAKMKLHPATR
jgi:DUF1680 family protein